MRNPKNLTFWPNISQFIVGVYQFTCRLPNDEKYNLVSQTKRAAVSIRLNVVEGAACDTGPEYARFLGYAYRSTREALTAIELCVELGLCQVDSVAELISSGDQLAGAIYVYRQAVSRDS